jgi:hypothetical protein
MIADENRKKETTMNPTKFFAIMFAAAFLTLVALDAKGEPAHHGKCLTFAPVTIVAKTVKKTTAPDQTAKPKKVEKPTIITVTYEGAKKPVSFDSKGKAEYHEEMIPVMHAVNLPVLSDVGIATRREATATGHVVMRLFADVTGE